LSADRTILDDLTPEALAQLQREAFLAGAWAALAWWVAFYAAHGRR
jgi:hypothetical protein